MNMISTGAFLPEMDASNKQETVAEKFARVWEKKNAKAARAGGVSLMALSLAACGSDSEEAVVETDTTPFDQADIDAAVEAAVADTAVSAATTASVAGSVDSIALNEGTDDTVTVAAGTLDAGDVIVDGDATDSDEVNITTTGAVAAATISGVETVNIVYDALVGGAGNAIDADNISGADINVSSARLGFAGAVQVDNAGDNNIDAGEGVTALTVNGLTTGSVDASGLTTVTTDTADTTATATARTTAITVDGDIAMNASVSTFAATDDFTLNITATDAAVVTLDLTNGAGAGVGAVAIGDDGSITINNTGDVTIAAATDELNAADIAAAGASVAINGGAVRLTSDGAANTGALAVGSFDVTQIEVATTDSVTLSGAGGQTIVVSEEDATVVVQGAAATAATDAITVNVTDDQAAGSITATANLATLNLNVGADSGTDRVDTIATVAVTADMNLTMAQDLTITTLTNGATADTMTVSGTGDLTITNATLMGTGGFDASALVGGVTATNTDANGEFMGGSGDDTITTANVATSFEATLGAGDDSVVGNTVNAGTLVVDGGAGDDTVSATSFVTGTFVASMGAGDDTVTFDAVTGVGTASITVDGGDGDDTLDLGTTAVWTGANTTVSITNIETIDIENGSALKASDVSGQTWNVVGDATANAVLTVTDDSTTGSMTLDLSGLTFDATMAAGAIGTAVTMNNSDDITASAGVDVFTITGAAATYTDVDVSGTFNDGDTITGSFGTITGYSQGTDANADGDLQDAGEQDDIGVLAANGVSVANNAQYTGSWNATTETFTLNDEGSDTIIFNDAGALGGGDDTAYVLIDATGIIV